MIHEVLIFLALGIAAMTLAAFLWSIVFPARRIWPSKRYTPITPFLVWLLTFTLLGVLILFEVWGWGDLALPNWARFGVGLPLILIGNVVVWMEVLHFRAPQTVGAKGTWRTVGMYRISRNPQHMADIDVVGRLMVLSAAPSVMIVGFPANAVLVAAPFSEDSWLKVQHGTSFETYASRVRRYLRGFANNTKTDIRRNSVDQRNGLRADFWQCGNSQASEVRPAVALRSQ